MQLTDWPLVEVVMLLIVLTHILDKNQFRPSSNTTLLVMVTLSPPLLLCLSKIFRHGNKNYFSLVMVYSVLFNNVYTAYVEEIQLPSNGIWLLSIPQSSTQSSSMAWHWSFSSYHLKYKCSCS
jgi:hypothetical protein